MALCHGHRKLGWPNGNEHHRTGLEGVCFCDGFYVGAKVIDSLGGPKVWQTILGLGRFNHPYLASARLSSGCAKGTCVVFPRGGAGVVSPPDVPLD